MSHKFSGEVFYECLSENPRDFSINYDSGKDFGIHTIEHTYTKVGVSIKIMDNFFRITDGIEIITPTENYIKTINPYIALKIVNLASSIKNDKYPDSDLKLVKKLTSHYT